MEERSHNSSAGQYVQSACGCHMAEDSLYNFLLISAGKMTEIRRGDTASTVCCTRTQDDGTMHPLVTRVRIVGWKKISKVHIYPLAFV